MNPNMLIKYYKNSHKRKGVIIAIDKNVLGWSLCHSKDKFDRIKGLRIALSRATYLLNLDTASRDIYCFENLPQSLVKDYKEMRTRSFKYFKNDKS